MSKSTEGSWVITNQAMKLTGYDEHFIHQLAEKGLIKAHPVDDDWVINKEGLLSYYKKMKKEE